MNPSRIGRRLAESLFIIFCIVTINFMLIRFMPGDPVQTMLARASLRPEASQAMQAYYTSVFGLDVPIWRQYLTFWGALLSP